MPLEIERRPARPADPARNFVSYERIKRAMRWSPRVDLDEGLNRTVAWMRDARST